MEKSALLGGTKTVTIDYQTAGNMPLVSEKSKKAVMDLLDKGQISASPLVQAFEKKFADYTGSKYSLCTNNGTASLHSALFAVGVGPGDEVIVPTYTFWATAVPIIAGHGIPVFCDVDPDSYCLDPASIEKKITKNTKAIMVVHVWGNPADMDSIMDIAKKYDLKVIEDCSHAHGAMWKDKKIGSIGDVGCFSLQGSKPLPAGEGGILVTDNRTYYERAVAFGHYDRVGSFPSDSLYSKYYLTGLGYKYRVHPLGIAIAECELDELDNRNDIRMKNALAFEAGISSLPFMTPQKIYDAAKRQYSYHYMTYDSSKFGGLSLQTFLKALRSEGVICGDCGYGRLHQSPLFTDGQPYGKGCPVKCSSAAENPDRNKFLDISEYLAMNTFMAAPRFEKECDDLIAQYISAYKKIALNLDGLLIYEKANPVDQNASPKSGRSINIL